MKRETLVFLSGHVGRYFDSEFLLMIILIGAKRELDFVILLQKQIEVIYQYLEKTTRTLHLV